MAKRPESVRARLHRVERSHSTATEHSTEGDRVAQSLEVPPQFHQKNILRVLCRMAIGSLLLTVSTVGCATVQGVKYTYKTLPSTYIASARENPQTIDLTRLASATTRSNVLDRGDVAELSISAGLNEKDIARLLIRIESDGSANIPQVGRLQLAGLELEAAEAIIHSECVERGLYRNPNITMTKKTQRMNRIIVAGAVKKPSSYELPRGQCDLLAALCKAEGLDPAAGTQVIIRNPGVKNDKNSERIAGQLQNGIDPAGHSVEQISAPSDTIKVDLISATKNGTGGYQLEDGAIVYVEKRDPEPLHVIGLVMKPGRFEFPVAEEMRVTDAIALAGGVSSILADKIFVIRRKPGSEEKPVDLANPDRVETFIIQLSLANAKQVAASNIRLSPGDVVSVEQTPATFMMELFRRVGFGLGGSVPLGNLF